MISYCLRRVVVFQDVLIHEKRGYIYLLAIGIPLALSLLPFTTNDYGNNGAWCSIDVVEVSADSSLFALIVLKSISTAALWNLLVLYGPLWIAVLYSIWSSVRVGKTLIGLRLVLRGEKGEDPKSAADLGSDQAKKSSEVSD